MMRFCLKPKSCFLFLILFSETYFLQTSLSLGFGCKQNPSDKDVLGNVPILKVFLKRSCNKCFVWELKISFSPNLILKKTQAM